MEKIYKQLSIEEWAMFQTQLPVKWERPQRVLASVTGFNCAEAEHSASQVTRVQMFGGTIYAGRF